MVVDVGDDAGLAREELDLPRAVVGTAHDDRGAAVEREVLARRL